MDNATEFPVYLDYAATAPLGEEAARAMEPFWMPGPANLPAGANANALYGAGRAAFDLLEDARRRVARALGARRPDEIVFTSGATEADDAAVPIGGVVLVNRARGVEIDLSLGAALAQQKDWFYHNSHFMLEDASTQEGQG